MALQDGEVYLVEAEASTHMRQAIVSLKRAPLARGGLVITRTAAQPQAPGRQPSIEREQWTAAMIDSTATALPITVSRVINQTAWHNDPQGLTYWAKSPAHTGSTTSWRGFCSCSSRTDVRRHLEECCRWLGTADSGEPMLDDVVFGVFSSDVDLQLQLR